MLIIFFYFTGQYKIENLSKQLITLIQAVNECIYFHKKKKIIDISQWYIYQNCEYMFWKCCFKIIIWQILQKLFYCRRIRNSAVFAVLKIEGLRVRTEKLIKELAKNSRFWEWKLLYYNILCFLYIFKPMIVIKSLFYFLLAGQEVSCSTELSSESNGKITTLMTSSGWKGQIYYKEITFAGTDVAQVSTRRISER